MKKSMFVRAWFLSDECQNAFVAHPAVRDLPHDEPPKDGMAVFIRVFGTDRRGIRHAVRLAAAECHAMRVDTIVLK